jgi:hypothetical protein
MGNWACDETVIDGIHESRRREPDDPKTRRAAREKSLEGYRNQRVKVFKGNFSSKSQARFSIVLPGFTVKYRTKLAIRGAADVEGADTCVEVIEQLHKMTRRPGTGLGCIH